MIDGRPAPGLTLSWCCCCGRTWSTEFASDSAAPRVLNTSTSRCLPARPARAMSTSTSCPIPGGRDWLPDCYSTTLGGTLYATTPGGQRPGQRVRVAGRGRGGASLDLPAGPSAGCSFEGGGCLEPKPSSLNSQSDATRPCA